jgi:hypothetical protein
MARVKTKSRELNAAVKLRVEEGTLFPDEAKQKA